MTKKKSNATKKPAIYRDNFPLTDYISADEEFDRLYEEKRIYNVHYVFMETNYRRTIFDSNGNPIEEYSDDYNHYIYTMDPEAAADPNNYKEFPFIRSPKYWDHRVFYDTEKDVIGLDILFDPLYKDTFKNLESPEFFRVSYIADSLKGMDECQKENLINDIYDFIDDYFFNTFGNIGPVTEKKLEDAIQEFEDFLYTNNFILKE